MDKGAWCKAASKDSASAALARANGTKTRLAAQLESTPWRTASCTGSDNGESSARRRLTQLASLPRAAARARWLSPSARAADNIQACSMGSKARP